MLRACVERDQFAISPNGIVHKPTDATFIPDPTDPKSGILRVGHLGERRPDEGGFVPVEVCRLMDELWFEYVDHNPEFFGGLRRHPH